MSGENLDRRQWSQEEIYLMIKRYYSMHGFHIRIFRKRRRKKQRKEKEEKRKKRDEEARIDQEIKERMKFLMQELRKHEEN